MELFGIICSAPGAFIAGGFYFLAFRDRLRRPLVGPRLALISALLLACLVVECVLLALLGPATTRALLGPLFYPVHLALWGSSLPAVATLLTIKIAGTRFDSWLVVAFVCGLFLMFIMVTQYWVFKELPGVDAEGGPYAHIRS